MRRRSAKIISQNATEECEKRAQNSEKFPAVSDSQSKSDERTDSQCHESDLIFSGNGYNRPDNRTNDCGCSDQRSRLREAFSRGNNRLQTFRLRSCFIQTTKRRQDRHTESADGGPPHSKARKLSGQIFASVSSSLSSPNPSTPRRCARPASRRYIPLRHRRRD
jgi:hypothetical protein